MNYKDVIKLLEKLNIWYTFNNDIIVFSIETKSFENGYNFNINDTAIDYDYLIEEIKNLTKIVGFKDLKIGDTINYDMELKNKNLVNKTALILDKNDNHIKLHENNIKWYCSIDMFYQLKNVSIVESD